MQAILEVKSVHINKNRYILIARPENLHSANSGNFWLHFYHKIRAFLIVRYGNSVSDNRDHFWLYFYYKKITILFHSTNNSRNFPLSTQKTQLNFFPSEKITTLFQKALSPHYLNLKSMLTWNGREGRAPETSAYLSVFGARLLTFIFGLSQGRGRKKKSKLALTV